MKTSYRENEIKNQILEAEKIMMLNLKGKDARLFFEKWIKENSKDEYTRQIVTFTIRWAKYMQYLMRKHNKPVFLIAKNTAKLCNFENISYYMFTCSVSILEKVWKFGDELYIWFESTLH